MGNAISPCFQGGGPKSSSAVKLVFWEGTTRILTGRHLAGEIMFENPDKMVCDAHSFFIGRPLPALAIDDALLPGNTYFILPLDRFAGNVLTAPSLSTLSASPRPAPINFKGCPFEYVNGADGRVLIKVVPEFITKMIYRGQEEEEQEEDGMEGSGSAFLCSTPELKKHYEQLVRSKDQTWSPKLETISEYKNSDRAVASHDIHGVDDHKLIVENNAKKNS